MISASGPTLEMISISLTGPTLEVPGPAQLCHPSSPACSFHHLIYSDTPADNSAPDCADLCDSWHAGMFQAHST